MSQFYAVFLSDNPGPFVKEDGPEKGVIVTEVNDSAEIPKTHLFAMACSDLQLGCPRISSVLPYLLQFDPSGWRSVSVGGQTFWTNREPNSFA